MAAFGQQQPLMGALVNVRLAPGTMVGGRMVARLAGGCIQAEQEMADFGAQGPTTSIWLDQ
jgi:hypothetical protein